MAADRASYGNGQGLDKKLVGRRNQGGEVSREGSVGYYLSFDMADAAS